MSEPASRHPRGRLGSSVDRIPDDDLLGRVVAGRGRDLAVDVPEFGRRERDRDVFVNLRRRGTPPYEKASTRKYEAIRPGGWVLSDANYLALNFNNVTRNQLVGALKEGSPFDEK